MKHPLLILLSLCLSLSLAAKPKADKDKSLGLNYLEASFDEYDALQKQIHSFAELGYHEYKSAEALCEELRKNGFTLERGVAGIPTAFIASYGSGSPVIGLMAEYDAIKGMAQECVPYKCAPTGGGNGHACGHNLLGSAAVAGAVAISKYLAAGHPGTVKLFGCPAEEGGGGKAYMTREGCFDGLDVMLDWHPDTQITTNDKTGLANVQVRFSFKGRASHASGAPENGRSALDAVESLDYMINMMREHVPSDSRIHYVITNGGKAPNVVPDYAEVVYYFRNPSRMVVRDIFARALEAAKGAAMGTGTSMSYEILSGNYERLPNKVLSDAIYSNLLKVGGISYSPKEMEFALQIMQNSGVEDPRKALWKVQNVVPPTENHLSEWVSSDVGNVTWVVPTGSFRMAAFVPGGSGHCWQQTSSGGTTIGTKGLIAAAKVFYLTAYDLLTDPSLLKSAKAEFLASRGEDFQFVPLMGDRQAPVDGIVTPSRAKSIDSKMLSRLEKNAYSDTSFLSRDIREVVRKEVVLDTSCTYRVPTGVRTDQMNSGRCWLFSTLNILRAELIAKTGDENFQFSQTYGQFYDVLEKCNRFLENVIESSENPLDDRYVQWLFNKPIGDGGQFLNAAHLIDKYGVVPLEAMPERYSSTDNPRLMSTVLNILRRYGLQIRAQGSDAAKIKEAALLDVYRLLSATLGIPPKEFEYQGVSYTPLSFRNAFVPHDMESDYAILMNDPTRPYYKVYQVLDERNCYEYSNWTFLNLPMSEIEAAGIESLKSGRMFYISADTLHDNLQGEGIYDLSTFEALDSTLGISLAMTKSEALQSCEIRSVHAIAVAGVRLSRDSTPESWLIENSYGTERGQDGFVTFSAPWFNRYVLRAVVEKRFLPAQTLEKLGQTPETIPAWNPTY